MTGRRLARALACSLVFAATTAQAQATADTAADDPYEGLEAPAPGDVAGHASEAQDEPTPLEVVAGDAPLEVVAGDAPLEVVGDEPAPKPPEPAGPLQVVVTGEKQQASTTESNPDLDRRDVQRLAGAFGDAFRAIEVMPGVVPMASGAPHFFVRGATPSANGYFIDGIRVPFLFHLAIGPSVIAPALVDDVTFYPGAFPARYGRQVGAIVAATLREPVPRVRAEGNIRLYDAGVFVETPVTDKATMFVAARYAYTGLILPLFAPETRIGYWDYQAGGRYQATAVDEVRVFIFGSHDYLGTVENDVEAELFGTTFHRVHARLTHRPKSGPTLMGGVTFGYDRTGLGGEVETIATSYRAQGELDWLLHPKLRVRAGADLHAERLAFERTTTPPTQPEAVAPVGTEEFEFDIGDAFASRNASAVGAWLDLVIRPHDAVEIVPGLRADVFSEAGIIAGALDPRSMLRIKPTDWLTTVTSAGLMHQRPTLIIPAPGLVPRGLKSGLQQAVHLSQGVEFGLPLELTAGAAGFAHFYQDITDLTATCSAGIDDCEVTDRADGRAFGLEVLLRRSLSETVGGLISYTLSRSERTAFDRSFPSDFDRTHVLHFALGVRLPARWHVGGRLTTYSGRPYSLISFDNPQLPTQPTLIGQRNALRRDWFHRIDLRIEKRWVVAERGWVSLVIEGLNITARKEIVDFDCRVAEVIGSSSGVGCEGQEIGPITIPSIGVAGGI